MEAEDTTNGAFPTEPDYYIALVTEYGLQVLLALAIFVIGKWIAGLVRKGARRGMEKAHVDPVLVGFLSNLLFYVLMVAVLISAIGQVGIETTSFVAVLGAAGLAVGFALQGSLANFAAGVLVILFRPFKVGDFINAGGVAGIVEEIGILFTQMRTPDNKRIILPNAQIMGRDITNFSVNPTRRVDMIFGVSYSDDIDKVKGILRELVEGDERVLKDPAPMIVLTELGDSSVDFAVRPWVNAADYWGFYFDMHERVKKRFDQEGISIPFPQRDVHLFKENNA